MVLPSDRLAIAAALLTGNAVGREPRVMRVRNTLELGEFWLSAALVDDVLATPTLHVVTRPQPLALDDAGNLMDLLSNHSGTLVESSASGDAW
jgi:hypothetical protein